MAGKTGRSTSLTPEQRSLRAQVAAHTRWSRADADAGRKQAEKAQRGLVEKFAREIDPDGRLDPEERYRRAKHARDAHMAKLALNRSKKRGGADAA